MIKVGDRVQITDGMQGSASVGDVGKVFAVSSGLAAVRFEQVSMWVSLKNLAPADADTNCTEGSHDWRSEPNQPGVPREVCVCGAIRSGVAVPAYSDQPPPASQDWTPYDRYAAAALTGLLARGGDTVPIGGFVAVARQIADEAMAARGGK